MGEVLIEEFLTGDSEEIRDMAANEAVLVGFLTLAKTIDDLPDVTSRFYEESRSLYQVTASGYEVEKLMATLADFFGDAAKAPGKNLPVSLRFDPTVKSLRGIRKDQALFLQKLKTGAFYGALWPWQRESGKVEILLGYCSPSISNTNYSRLGTLVHKFLSKKKIESISDVGGQIHGISLPSFLQMSEMEGATYTLQVTSADRVGHLYIHEGNLIAASYDNWRANEAAYRIISWEKAAIQIQAPDPRRVREIQEPLMHVMMESLKIKDEAGGDQPAPPSPPEPPAEAPAPPAAEAESAEAVENVPDFEVPVIADGPVDERPLYNFMMQAPFEKPLDHSAEKQRQMPRQTKLLIALGIVIVFALVVTFGGAWFKARSVTKRYETLMAELNATRELDARVVRLIEYIQEHPQDAHRADLEKRIEDIGLEIERRDFEKTLYDVKQLPVDATYEKKALSLYIAFLSKHPESRYVEQINRARDNIGKVVGAASFTRLATTSEGDFLQRHAAYQEYLDRFPDGDKRQEVERMIGQLANEYAQAIEKQAQACDREELWDDCLAECERFLSVFAEASAAETVRQVQRRLNEKKELLALIAKADQVADDFAQAKRVYAAYLASHPQTSQKAAIDQRIATLDAALDKQAEWNRTAADAGNAAKDVFDRIQRLEAYIDANAKGPYVEAARALREQLEPQRKKALEKQRADASRRKVLARKKAEQARRAQEAAQKRQLQKQTAAKLRPVADRFMAHADGTVSDRVTGLTWCLLDSRADLGKCLTHRAAQAYVEKLTTGGHTDWRLPTAGELASLYKTKPFFPATGAPWYWSAQSYARGYHRVVDVVTSTPETVFTRTAKPEDDCGTVRAVRR